jgi:hypothetical protein
MNMPPVFEMTEPMQTTPRILVLSPSNLATDPRVNRQLRLLQSDCRVTAAGFGDPQIDGVEFIPIRSERKTLFRRLQAALRLKARRYEDYYWHIGYVHEALAGLRDRRFDAIIANDADTWPLAHAIRGGARLLFDAHEYAPRQVEDRPYWRFFYRDYRTWLCREFLPRADAVVTVCDGIADEFARVFGVRRPLVIRNTPPYQSFSPGATDPGRVRMIHHGAASRSRRIEVMIDLMAHLDARFTLDLMLVGSDSSYLQFLRRRAAGDRRIRFRDPVPALRIIEETRAYDLGLFLLPPTNFNLRFALPNKFFEFIQARLGVAIGPSPEMARIVRTHACGVVADSFRPEALAAVLGEVTPAQLATWKENAHRAAHCFCWEAESRVLREEIDRLLALGACVA